MCSTKLYLTLKRLITNRKSQMNNSYNQTNQIRCCWLLASTWGSWLNAVLYYAKNLLEVKAIVESFED